MHDDDLRSSRSEHFERVRAPAYEHLAFGDLDLLSAPAKAEVSSERDIDSNLATLPRIGDARLVGG